MNTFNSLITPEFKEIFNMAIDTLLADTGLSTKCKLVFNTSMNNSDILCNNCIFDPITQLSSNIYNGSGPVFFENNAVCPICLGSGRTTTPSTKNTHEEIVYFGVISESKKFLQIDTTSINIPDGSIQTICSINYLPQIKNASYLVLDPNLNKYGNYSYERFNDPNPCGFGKNNYIVTVWKRK